jgi:hypothetical protein
VLLSSIRRDRVVEELVEVAAGHRVRLPSEVIPMERCVPFRHHRADLAQRTPPI